MKPKLRDREGAELQLETEQALRGFGDERPDRALALLDELSASGDLDQYHLLHAARAEMLRRIGSPKEAAKSYTRALALVTNDTERRFLERRLFQIELSGA